MRGRGIRIRRGKGREGGTWLSFPRSEARISIYRSNLDRRKTRFWSANTVGFFASVNLRTRGRTSREGGKRKRRKGALLPPQLRRQKTHFLNKIQIFSGRPPPPPRPARDSSFLGVAAIPRNIKEVISPTSPIQEEVICRHEKKIIVCHFPENIS